MNSRKFQSISAHRLKRGSVKTLGLQKGIALLEAMIAILVFSIGILGVVGLQARSVQGLTEAGFRSQAVEHASELISEMWMTDPGVRATVYGSANGGSRYTGWKGTLVSGSRALPGSLANPPVVTVTSVQTPITMSPGSVFSYTDVTIQIFWVVPGAPTGSPPSRYTTTARILEPQS